MKILKPFPSPGSFISDSQFGGGPAASYPGRKNRKNFSFNNNDVQRIDQENQRLFRVLSRLSAEPGPELVANVNTSLFIQRARGRSKTRAHTHAQKKRTKQNTKSKGTDKGGYVVRWDVVGELQVQPQQTNSNSE